LGQPSHATPHFSFFLPSFFCQIPSHRSTDSLAERKGQKKETSGYLASSAGTSVSGFSSRMSV
jgi:hypothetical protein